MERRQACALRMSARRIARCGGGTLRLPAFRFLLLCLEVLIWRSSTDERKAGTAPGFPFPRTGFALHVTVSCWRAIHSRSRMTKLARAERQKEFAVKNIKHQGSRHVPQPRGTPWATKQPARARVNLGRTIRPNLSGSLRPPARSAPTRTRSQPATRFWGGRLSSRRSRANPRNEAYGAASAWNNPSVAITAS